MVLSREPCRDDNQNQQLKTKNKKTEDAKTSSVFFITLPTSYFTLPYSLTTQTFTDTTTPA